MQQVDIGVQKTSDEAVGEHGGLVVKGQRPERREPSVDE
jgi:hypothetical protein